MNEKAPKPEITPENKDAELDLNPERQWTMDPSGGIVEKEDRGKLMQWHEERIDRDNK